MEQRSIDKDCDTLGIVRDHIRIFQLRLHEASQAAHTSDAIDAISDLSLALEDLTSEFNVKLARLVQESHREDAPRRFLVPSLPSYL